MWHSRLLGQTVAVHCVRGQLLSSSCVAFATIHFCGRWGVLKHTKLRAAVVTAVLSLAFALVGTPAQAAPKPFWTPDAMRAAVPMDSLVKAPAFTPKEVAKGQSAIIQSIPN